MLLLWEVFQQSSNRFGSNSADRLSDYIILLIQNLCSSCWRAITQLYNSDIADLKVTSCTAILSQFILSKELHTTINHYGGCSSTRSQTVERWRRIKHSSALEFIMWRPRLTKNYISSSIIIFIQTEMWCFGTLQTWTALVFISTVTNGCLGAEDVYAGVSKFTEGNRKLSTSCLCSCFLLKRCFYRNTFTGHNHPGVLMFLFKFLLDINSNHRKAYFKNDKSCLWLNV